MQITTLSILYTAVWCCVFLLSIHCLYKTGRFIGRKGVPVLLLLYTLGMARMVLPLDFTGAVVLPEGRLYPGIYQRLRAVRGHVGTHPVSLFFVLLCIWLAGFCLLLIRYLISYCSTLRSIRLYAVPARPEAQAMLSEIMQASGRQMRLSLLEMPIEGLPFGMGAFRKRILIPEKQFTEEAMRCMLLHEYTHFLNHDFWLKQFTAVFCMFFWWIPSVYLLKGDVEQLLEVRCDLTAVQGLSRAERITYLETVVYALRSGKPSTPYASTHLSASREAKNIKERALAAMGKLPRASRALNILVLSIFSLMTVLSYAFIIQPDSPAPASTEPNTIDFEIKDSYVLHTKDGQYWLYIPNMQPEIVLESDLSLYKELGFKIIEE